MQQSQKIFSLEEAELLVPFISNAFSEIFRLNEKIRELTTDINDLLGIWGEEITDSRHVDHEMYRERLESRNSIFREAQSIFEEISRTGAVIKDTETGLVDFYSKRGEELIMLCWKFGEERIKFWHPVAGGFGKRKPVEELGKKQD